MEKVGREKAGRKRLPGLTVADGFTRHPFDEANGTRTSGLVAGRHLKSGHRHDRHATAYYGVAPSVFQALVRRWRRSGPAAPIEETTFVDIGAGMGRAMLLAAEMPFRAVLGVELNPTLVRIARRNLALWRKAGRARAPMRLVCGDAAEFAFPERALCGIPLQSVRSGGDAALSSLRCENVCGPPGELDILYVNNEQEGVLEMQKGLVRLFQGRCSGRACDAIADHRILANQPDGEYASANYEDCSIWRWRGQGQGTRNESDLPG